MKKEIYFRIIELENHQVLLQKDYEEEEDLHNLIITFHLKSCCIKQTHGFKSENARDKAFETYTHEQAQKNIDSSSKLF